MKKLLCVALALIIICSFSACGKSKSKNYSINQNVGSLFDDDNSSENTSQQEPTKTMLSPFEGIDYVISGISPNCSISVNIQNCDPTVQKNVSFSLDKSSYANGETAVLTAKLSGYNSNQEYAIDQTSMDIPISGQPEYITSVDDIDLTKVKPELDDFLDAHIAKAEAGQTSYPFGVYVVNLIEISNVKAGDIYFQSLKAYKEKPDNAYYNYLSFTYSAKQISSNGFTGEAMEPGNLYGCFSAVNIIKYPDGTIKWGSGSPDSFDFLVSGSGSGMEDCISKCIIINSDNYNITKLDKTSKSTEGEQQS